MFGGIVLGATVLSIAVMVWLGLAWHGMPSRYSGNTKPVRTTPAYFYWGPASSRGRLPPGGNGVVAPILAVAALGFAFLAFDEVLRIREETSAGILSTGHRSS